MLTLSSSRGLPAIKVESKRFSEAFSGVVDGPEDLNERKGLTLKNDAVMRSVLLRPGLVTLGACPPGHGAG